MSALTRSDTELSPPVSDPLVFVDRASARGAPPEEIQKYIDLYERVTKLRAEAAFNRDMAACHADMPVVVKDATNKHTGNPYARLEAIQGQCRSTWTRHGFSLAFADGERIIPELRRTIVDVRHKDGHCVRYHIDLADDGVGAKGGANMNPLQGGVSSGTYAQRILTCRIFGITIADTDVDGQSMADVLQLTPEQRGELADLIEQGRMDVARLLKWVKAESLDKITQKQFKLIVTTYRQKKGGAA